MASSDRDEPARIGAAASWASWRGLLVVLGAKLLVSLLVLGSGFVAVSDDDYARVSIAQAFAHAPRLDPSGTSWLPAPFWVYGGVMAALGRSLEVARGIAVVAGLASAALIYAAARRLWPERPRAALVGAVIAAAIPWSARLGVATVPELPAAALALYALATLAPGSSPRARLLGGLALFFATLSRYEPWLLTVPFACLCLWDARSLSTARARVVLGCASVLALAGPLLWVLHNQLAYGDALRFHARVTSYRRAIGAASTWADAFAYPLTAAREEPEVFVVALLALALLLARAERPSLRAARRPAALVGLLVLGLSLAAARDGAPTHHLARAWLVVLLFAALLAGRLLDAAARGGARSAAASLACGALAVLVGAAVRSSSPALHFEPRAAEVAIGQDAARLLPPHARLLLEVSGYGYLATSAGFGRPEQIIADRRLDPRGPVTPSSFDEVGSLRDKLAAERPGGFVARVTRATYIFGEPAVTQGGLGLWLVPSAE